MDKQVPPYARQWPGFVCFCVMLAPGALFQAHSGSVFIAAIIQIGVLLGIFIAGFCYRERLVQSGREPRLRMFRRMLK